MDSNLSTAVREESLRSYIVLRGGYSIPLAGALYWFVLGALGLYLDPYTWTIIAFAASGLIIVCAYGFSKLFRNPVFTSKTATSSLLVPAFVAMFLFWPMAIAAFWEANHLTPLILAIGMSLHWPIIGWSYGRPAPYIAHAVVRALVVFAIWTVFPEHRYTYLPLSVAGIYLLTIVLLWFDSQRLGKQLATG